MKRASKKLITDEKGQALIIALVLMLLGGLIIAPLLGFVRTGLTAGQVHEERMAELYAADAGIEDALWKIVSDQVPAGPYLLTVNGKEVTVMIATTTTGQFLADLFGGTEPKAPHADWMLVYACPSPGTFIIKVEYQGTAQTKYITGVGAWFHGTYAYDGSATPINWDGVIITEDITSVYPPTSFEVTSYAGGTAFIWEWQPPTPRPKFNPGDVMYQTFKFTPAEEPSHAIGWAMAGSNDIWISAEGEFTANVITAIAADSSTGKQTVVVANATRQGQGTEEDPYTVNLNTWEVSLD